MRRNGMGESETGVWTRHWGFARKGTVGDMNRAAGLGKEE